MSQHHVPGPWHVREWSCHAATTIGVPSNDREGWFDVVAECSGIGGRFTSEQELANASLIAAAPDMLTMLRQLAGECAACGGSAEIVRGRGPAPEDEYSEPCDDCHDIRQVIAKAEGRS